MQESLKSYAFGILFQRTKNNLEAGGGNVEKVIFIRCILKILSCSYNVHELSIVQVIANIFFVDHVLLKFEVKVLVDMSKICCVVVRPNTVENSNVRSVCL